MTTSSALSVAVLLGMGLLTLTPVAHAGDGGPLSIGARAMSYSPQDGDESWNGGIQARLRLPILFAVEASIDHRKYDVGTQTVEDYPVQLSAIMFILPKLIVVQPYLLAGGGWYNTKVEVPGAGDDTDSRFAPHAGAGIDFSLGSRWFIDTTYRYVWLKETGDIDDSGHMVTVGLNFRL